MRALDFPGVNGIAVCECGCQSFIVGLQVNGNSNHIRCVQCETCGLKMSVPYMTAGDRTAALKHHQVLVY